jgi:TRAP-type mannitol/chloroaromatic compound transport system substrate-binding protein
MKLTLNRTEEQKAGMFKKSTVYWLDVYLEATPEEMVLIRQHQWDKLPFCEGMFLASRVVEFTVGDVVGKPTRYGFKSVGELAHVESQVIENAKSLKQQLEAAVGFTSGGRREVEL